MPGLIQDAHGVIFRWLVDIDSVENVDADLSLSG